MDQKFRRAERLRSKKRINEVFSSGSSRQVGRCRISWLASDTGTPYPARTIFTVSKKKFRRATDRNLVRRRMREAYRTYKHDLYAILDKHHISIDLAIVYTGDQLPAFEELQENIRLIIKKLRAYYEKAT